jgi:hypothetical protein
MGLVQTPLVHYKGMLSNCQTSVLGFGGLIHGSETELSFCQVGVNSPLVNSYTFTNTPHLIPYRYEQISRRSVRSDL